VTHIEGILNSLIWARYGEGDNLIEERRKHGLPDLGGTAAFLRDQGFHTTVLPNGYLYRWLVVAATSFLLQRRFPNAELSRRVNAYYNANFYRADNRLPSYRKAIVGSRTRDISRLRETLCPEPDATEAEKLYSLQLLDMLMHTLTEEWSSLALSLHERLASKEREFAEQEAAREQVIASLKEELADKEQYIQALTSKQRAESEGKAAAPDLRVKAEALSNRLFVKEQQAQKLASALEEKERELRGLASRLSSHERAAQIVSIRLVEKEAELNRIKSTLGWRLLSLYGPIKYRYLLPVYRFLNLLPNGQGADLKSQSPQLYAVPQVSAEAASTGDALLQENRLASSFTPRLLLEELLKQKLSLFLSQPGSRLVFPQFSEPLVSILISTFNKAEYLYQCLETILAHTDIAFEVIIVDDGSSEATLPQFLAKLVNVQTVRNEKNLGFIKSCNKGAQLARGRYILFLNNDVMATPRWLAALVETIERYPQCGAVGGKLVRPDGTLQEAGSIIWQDGSALGYGRDDDPSKPEYCYVREVDYVSGAYLLVRAEDFRKLGSFDERYVPAYFEDSDLCMGIRKLGHKVVYQPQATIVHYEFGSHSMEGARALCEKNHPEFKKKWAAVLPQQAANGKVLHGRDRREGRRVLVINDQIPAPYLGSGFPRDHKMLEYLSELGYVVTFIPTASRAAWQPTTQELQQMGIELFYGDSFDIDGLLQSRAGFYDLVLISRPHNGQRFLKLVRRLFPKARIIYDAEALFSKREILKAEIEGRKLGEVETKRLIKQETDVISEADLIISVSEAEREAILEQKPESKVEVWGHTHELQIPATSFSQRRDLLFVGGFTHGHPPNTDAVLHFTNSLFPTIRQALPGVRFIIVGSEPSEVIQGLDSQDVEVTGFVEDLREYYEKCRIFVVPLRFGAGINYKLTEAMSYGIPSVVSPLAASGLNIKDGREALIGNSDSDFVEKVIRLYRDEPLWLSIQEAEKKYIERHCSPSAMKKGLANILRSSSNAREHRLV
jgi:GT2 family glycosyltransferase/glycosyltransferase involved in cell wall biosynthesis